MSIALGDHDITTNNMTSREISKVEIDTLISFENRLKQVFNDYLYLLYKV